MKRLLFLVPVVVLIAVAALFYGGLGMGPPETLPSPLVGQPAPSFVLAALDGQPNGLARADLSGKATIVNFWASWCAPCRLEHPMLNALAGAPGVVLYGVAYKDDPEKARAFLSELGNPFARVGADRNGRTGIDWGITGVPETFVVDANGIVRAHISGPLTPQLVETVIWPALGERAGPGT